MGDPAKPSKHDEVPDLELGPLVPRTKQPQPQPQTQAPGAAARPAPAPSGGAPFDMFSGSFDEDHFGSGSSLSDHSARTKSSGAYDGSSMDLDDHEEQANLNLELSSYRPPGLEGSSAPSVPSGMPGAPSAAPGAPSRAPGAPAQTPTQSLAPALPEIDRSAVGLIARYGPAPSAIYLAPLYAFRVLSRQRELRTELRRLNGEVAAQERKLDEMFASLASGMRDSLEGDSRFAASYEPVRQLEAIAGERGAALSQTNEQFKAHSDQLEQQLHSVQAQTPPLEQERERATAEVTEREAALSRVAAKQKRFMIEARSIKMNAQQGAAPNAPLSPETTAQIQALETQAGALQPEVEQLQQELAQAQTALQDVRGQLGVLGQHTRRIQEQQKALARQFQGQLSAASAGVNEAERELTGALALIGRGVLAQSEGLGLDSTTVTAIRTGDINLQRLAESNALHLAALDAYDREVVQKGYLIAGGLVGAVLLAIVLVIVL